MHTSDLHQSFKFKIKFSKVFWGTRLRQWIARVREAGQGGACVAFLRMCLYEATSVACRIFLIKYLLFTSLNSAGKIITIYRTDVHSASCLSKKKPHMLYETLHFHQSIGESTIHVSVHTRFGTFHQCADQKFSRLLWFSFLTAAKIFLYCTTVHPALCPNIIAIKNVQMLWNLEHFQQFFFLSFFWLKRHLEIYEKSHSFWKYSFFGTEANP